MQSKRLNQLPPYLFVEIDRIKESYAEAGREILDLGIGDPDLGPPPELLQALSKALKRPVHHRYPPGRGLPLLVDAIRGWAKRIHGVPLERDEILVTLGSKEAIGHLPLAVTDGDSVVLVPDPGYPVYYSSAILAGAEPVRFPLLESQGYRPDLAAIDRGILRRAKLLILNYPNNPTAAVAGREVFRESMEFCRGNGVILVNDAAYSETTYGKRIHPLFPAARGSGVPYIEFFSFSKTFSITGWRVGFAIGSADVISSLARVKSNLDSGVFGAIQEAVAVTLERGFEGIVAGNRAKYLERRDELAGYLERSGLSFALPQATFYFWVETPGRKGSIDFCAFLMDETGVVAAPGVGFGELGEGHFRLSITSSIGTVREAGRRIEAISDKLGVY